MPKSVLYKDQEGWGDYSFWLTLFKDVCLTHGECIPLTATQLLINTYSSNQWVKNDGQKPKMREQNCLWGFPFPQSRSCPCIFRRHNAYTVMMIYSVIEAFGGRSSNPLPLLKVQWRSWNNWDTGCFVESLVTPGWFCGLYRGAPLKS